MLIFRNHEGKDMKKFFASVLFTIFTFSPDTTLSSVRNAADMDSAPTVLPQANREEQLEKLYQELPDLSDTEAVSKYLQKRLAVVQKADIPADEIMNPSSTSIVDTEELQKKQKTTISAYERIYQDSINKATAEGTLNQNVEIDGVFYRLKEDNTTTAPFVPDFPYVTIKLSNNREILAPAEEHIAYMLTTLNIEPTGLLRVTEEFVFVSNNEDFPEGFFRIFPKYAYSIAGEKRKLDLTLDSVTINNQEIPYQITEIGNFLHIEPRHPLDLPSGIYTYRFNYLIDRAVWFYDGYDELYWDITGRTIKNVIGSTNAIVILPTGKKFLEQNAFVSTKEGLKPTRTTITALSENSLGFADTEALAVGDDIHLLIRLEKGTIVPPDFAKKYMWYIHDHGAVLFALLALIAIFISYKISSTQLRRNQDKIRVNLKKTPAMFRLLNANTFDVRSFGAEILNLCAKGILELQKRNDNVVLFKKTDNLKKLTKPEQKFVNTLFPNTETTLIAAPESHLKLNRAYNYLKKQTYRRFNLYKLQLNGLYLIFSISMLLCGIIGASSIAVNPWHTFWVIFVCSLLIAIGLGFLTHKYKNKYIDISLKALLSVELLTISGWMAIYTSNLYAVIIVLTMGLIISYFKLFSRRSGLLRNKIKETEDLKTYLQKNTELTQTSRDFDTKIPYIFAFGLEGSYKETDAFSLINCITQQIKPNK